jgi:integrase
MTPAAARTRTNKVIEVLPKGTLSKQAKFEPAPDPLFIGYQPKDKRQRKALTRAMQQRAVKGTSDYIPYDTAMKTGNDLLWHGRQPQLGFYIIFSVNTGLRVGDTMRLQHQDLTGKAAGDVLLVTEQKTGKVRRIKLNDKIVEAYAYLINRMKAQRYRIRPEDHVFKSQKNHVFHTTAINRQLKKIFAGVAPVVSSHSLRKSFGRHVWEQNGSNEKSITVLREVFRHSSMAITCRYLGITTQEIDDIYMNL